MSTQSPRLIGRIILSALLGASVFLFPVQVSLVVGAVGLLLIPYYWEALFAVLGVELLYRGPSAESVFLSLLPLIAFGVFFLVELLRTFVREEVFRRS